MKGEMGMKKIFIIECNPKKEHSKRRVYVQTYIDEAKSCGHEVRIINLYDLNIDYLRFSGDNADHSLTGELKQAQDNLIWADQLVITYPIWCFAIPAILKSFIERTFSRDIIWKISEKGPQPILKNKTAVIMQSYDMPSIFMKYFLGDVPFKFWKVLLEKWCGFKIEKRFDLDCINSVSEKTKQKRLNDIKKFIAKL